MSNWVIEVTVWDKPDKHNVTPFGSNKVTLIDYSANDSTATFRVDSGVSRRIAANWVVQAVEEVDLDQLIAVYPENKLSDVIFYSYNFDTDGVERKDDL